MERNRGIRIGLVAASAAALAMSYPCVVDRESSDTGDHKELQTGEDNSTKKSAWTQTGMVSQTATSPKWKKTLRQLA